MPEIKLLYSREEVENLVVDDSSLFTDNTLYEFSKIELVEDGFEVLYSAIPEPEGVEDDEEFENGFVEYLVEDEHTPHETDMISEWVVLGEDGPYPENDDDFIILLTEDSKIIRDCLWDDEEGVWLSAEDDYTPINDSITHWMRLPPIPNAKDTRRSLKDIKSERLDKQHSEFMADGWRSVLGSPPIYAGLNVIVLENGNHKEIEGVYHQPFVPGGESGYFLVGSDTRVNDVRYWKKVSEYVK
jgi:hypothetical protein